MFLLLGIVKKNGILQVDYTNRLLATGMPVREAILEANRVRLRPILMTTLSIIAGLIPVAVGIGAGSEQRASIAVTIIGGQTLCLLLTLLVVPVAYSYFAEFEALPWREWTSRSFRWMSRPADRQMKSSKLIDLKLCAARKLSVLRGHFHLFPFFDKEGDADLQTGLQPGRFGDGAARRVAPHSRLRVCNFQLDKRGQLQADGIAVVL